MIKSLFHTPIWSKCHNLWNSKYCLTKGIFPNETQQLIDRYRNWLTQQNPANFVANDGLRNLSLLTLLLNSNQLPANNIKSLGSGLGVNVTSLINHTNTTFSQLDSSNNLIFNKITQNLTNFKEYIQTISEQIPDKYPEFQKMQNITFINDLYQKLTNDSLEVNNRTFVNYNSSYYATQEFFEYVLFLFRLFYAG